MGILLCEVVATLDHGPRERSLSSLLDTGESVVMWDVSQLTRELLPEVSLHSHRQFLRGETPFYVLHYALIRETNEVIDITEEALEGWLTTNAGVQREERVESALYVVRESANHFQPEVKKRILRYVALISKEMTLPR